MNWLLSVGVLSASTIAQPVLSVSQEPIQCTSTGAPVTCRADTFYGVLLAHEMSDHVCVQGKTWSYDGEAIHVRKGCSAEFLVNPRRSNAFGEGGYNVHGTGPDRSHTNGNVRPGGTAPDSGRQNQIVPSPQKNTIKQPIQTEGRTANGSPTPI